MAIFNFSTDPRVTFTRNSDASRQTSSSTLEFVGLDILRRENRGDGNGQLYLVEGARVNRVLRSEDLAVSPWTVQGVMTSNVSPSPSGSNTADEFSWSVAGRRFFQTGATAYTRATASIWCKKQGDGVQGRIRIGGLANNFAPPADWRRFIVSGSESLASWEYSLAVRHDESTGGTSDDVHLFWGAQLELGTLIPSSYIATSVATNSRAEDSLISSSFPREMVEGVFIVTLFPSGSSAEIVGDGVDQVIIGCSGNRDLRFRVNGGNLDIRLSDGSKSISLPSVTFSRDQKLRLLVDLKGSLTLFGATTGNGQVLGDLSPWSEGSQWRFGNALSGGAPYFGRFSDIEYQKLDIENVDIFSNDSVKLTFNQNLLVDSSFSNTSNYSIVNENGQNLTIQKVLTPKNTSVTNTVYLQTDFHPLGLEFSANAYNLRNTEGILFLRSGENTYKSRNTKVDSMLLSIPDVYDKSLGSNARGVLSATALVYEKMSGSQKDRVVSDRLVNTTVFVPPPSLVSIAVTPATPGVPIGSTLQLTATGTYSDASTANLTGSVTWTSATPANVTVSGSGLCTGVANGTSVVTAELGIVSGSTTVRAIANPSQWGETVIAGWSTMWSTVSLDTGGSTVLVNSISPSFGLSHASLTPAGANKPIWIPNDGEMGNQPSCHLGFSPVRSLSAANVPFGPNAKMSVMLIYRGTTDLSANTFGVLFEAPPGRTSPWLSHFFFSTNGSAIQQRFASHGNAQSDRLNAVGATYMQPSFQIAAHERDLASGEVSTFWFNNQFFTDLGLNGNGSGGLGTRTIEFGARSASLIPSGMVFVEAFFFDGVGLISKIDTHVKPYLNYYFGTSY